MLGAVDVYQARPYLRVASDYPTAERTIKEVEDLLLRARGAAVRLLGEPRVGLRHRGHAREHVHSKNEDVFFPGGRSSCWR